MQFPQLPRQPSLPQQHPAPSILSTCHFVVRPRRFECSFCAKKFARNEHLRRHIRSHVEAATFVCEHCEKVFSRKDSLRRHVLLTHEAPHSSGKDCPPRRADKACDQCAHIKMRCSGDQPCLRCKQRGSQCTTLRASRRRPNNSTNTAQQNPNDINNNINPINSVHPAYFHYQPPPQPQQPQPQTPQQPQLPPQYVPQPHYNSLQYPLFPDLDLETPFNFASTSSSTNLFTSNSNIAQPPYSSSTFDLDASLALTASAFNPASSLETFSSSSFFPQQHHPPPPPPQSSSTSSTLPFSHSHPSTSNTAILPQQYEISPTQQIIPPPQASLPPPRHHLDPLNSSTIPPPPPQNPLLEEQQQQQEEELQAEEEIEEQEENSEEQTDNDDNLNRWDLPDENDINAGKSSDSSRQPSPIPELQEFPEPNEPEDLLLSSITSSMMNISKHVPGITENTRNQIVKRLWELRNFDPARQIPPEKFPKVEILNIYLQLYFEHAYPHLLIPHKSTYDPNRQDWLIAIACIAYGARYSNIDKSHELSNYLIDICRQARAYIEASDPSSEVTFHVTKSKFFCLYVAAFCGDTRAFTLARGYHMSLISIARKLGIFYKDYHVDVQNPNSGDPSRHHIQNHPATTNTTSTSAPAPAPPPNNLERREIRWGRFIVREENKRLGLNIFCFDTLLSICWNFPSCMDVAEIQCSMPCSMDLWEAPDLDALERLSKNTSSQQQINPSPIWSTIQQIAASTTSTSPTSLITSKLRLDPFQTIVVLLFIGKLLYERKKTRLHEIMIFQSVPKNDNNDHTNESENNKNNKDEHIFDYTRLEQAGFWACPDEDRTSMLLLEAVYKIANIFRLSNPSPPSFSTSYPSSSSSFVSRSFTSPSTFASSPRNGGSSTGMGGYFGFSNMGVFNTSFGVDGNMFGIDGADSMDETGNNNNNMVEKEKEEKTDRKGRRGRGGGEDNKDAKQSLHRLVKMLINFIILQHYHPVSLSHAITGHKDKHYGSKVSWAIHPSLRGRNNKNNISAGGGIDELDCGISTTSSSTGTGGAGSSGENHNNALITFVNWAKSFPAHNRRAVYHAAQIIRVLKLGSTKHPVEAFVAFTAGLLLATYCQVTTILKNQRYQEKLQRRRERSQKHKLHQNQNSAKEGTNYSSSSQLKNGENFKNAIDNDNKHEGDDYEDDSDDSDDEDDDRNDDIQLDQEFDESSLNDNLDDEQDKPMLLKKWIESGSSFHFSPSSSSSKNKNKNPKIHHHDHNQRHHHHNDRRNHPHGYHQSAKMDIVGRLEGLDARKRVLVLVKDLIRNNSPEWGIADRYAQVLDRLI